MPRDVVNLTDGLRPYARRFVYGGGTADFRGTENFRIDLVNGPFLCRIESEQERVLLRGDLSRTRMIFISQLFEFTEENVNTRAGKLLSSTDTIIVQHTKIQSK